MEATVVDGNGKEISREKNEAFYNQFNEWLENASKKYNLFRDHYKNNNGNLYFKEKEIAKDFESLGYKDKNIYSELGINYTEHYATQDLHAYYIHDKVPFLVVVNKSYTYKELILKIVPKEFAKEFMENNFRTVVEETSSDENKKKFNEFVSILEEQPNNQA